VDELRSTFSGLRLPTSCPATAASVAVSADAYNDPLLTLIVTDAAGTHTKVTLTAA
jgi:hypothetical protein